MRLFTLLALGLGLTGVALAGAGRAAPAPLCPSPEVRIQKSAGQLELRCEGAVRRRFPVVFGRNPRGPKERAGDQRTPEGRYRVVSRVITPRFHRFLGLSYPNADDLRHAHALGISEPGGGIGIHGTRRGRAGLARAFVRLAHATGLGRLWGPTDGCIALTNEDVETLYDAVPIGTPVVIEP